MKINLLEIPVFYINMSKDKHKKKHIEQQLSDLGFKNVTRINAVEDKKNGRVGLSKSQLMALSQVSAPFIVLEDDADPNSFEPVIEVPDDADAVYLGNSQWGLQSSHAGFYLKYKKVEGYPKILRIFNMLSSHAILYLNQEYVAVCQRTTKYCAETYPMPMDVPFAMIQRFFNVYVINDPMFIQKDYEGKMSAAPQFTNKKLTSYKVRELYDFDPRTMYWDNII
jgi:hypothetical protein